MTTNYTTAVQSLPSAQQIYDAPALQIYRELPLPAPENTQPSRYASSAAAPAQYVYVIRPTVPVFPAGDVPHSYVRPLQRTWYARGYW